MRGKRAKRLRGRAERLTKGMDAAITRYLYRRFKKHQTLHGINSIEFDVYIKTIKRFNLPHDIFSAKQVQLRNN